jgi:hypothetical protein
LRFSVNLNRGIRVESGHCSRSREQSYPKRSDSDVVSPLVVEGDFGQ